MPLKLKRPKATIDEQLEHSRLTSLINSMADAVIAVDEDARVVLYNGATLNTLDVNNIKAGDRLSKIFAPIDKDNQPVPITQVIAQTKLPTTNRDLRLKYSDGSVINLYTSIAPVHLGYGKGGQRGYVILLRDITREKSLEEERDEFISVVSHELRTPIAIAEGNISNAQFTVGNSGNIEQIKQALGQAHDQVMFLADMINDLSTLSRAERGKLNVEIEAINVHDLVQELANSYTPEAQTRGLELKIELDPALELLYSSKLYVHEILQNFITNALKYTQRGHVTLGAKAYDKGVQFYVSDSGIGISKSDQERVFDKFFRSEDYRTRQSNGTGLGLYVTMKLARLVHAEISMESELNKGSTFTVLVPNLK
ncbi:MAG TPA: ATP-binding protein [Candidatus Saccharimonadales bacterium]|nr:ATP-binding protein [Candidatus Saccharimonadales bacterium]